MFRKATDEERQAYMNALGDDNDHERAFRESGAFSLGSQDLYVLDPISVADIETIQSDLDNYQYQGKGVAGMEGVDPDYFNRQPDLQMTRFMRDPSEINATASLKDKTIMLGDVSAVRGGPSDEAYGGEREAEKFTIGHELAHLDDASKDLIKLWRDAEKAGRPLTDVAALDRAIMKEFYGDNRDLEPSDNLVSALQAAYRMRPHEFVADYAANRALGRHSDVVSPHTSHIRAEKDVLPFLRAAHNQIKNENLDRQSVRVDPTRSLSDIRAEEAANKAHSGSSTPEKIMTIFKTLFGR